MNKQPLEKKHRFVLSIQTKILLWSGISFFISATLIILYAALALRTGATGPAEEKALDVARGQSSEIRGVLETTLSAGKTFTQSVIGVKTEGVELSRDQINAMLRQVLKANPQYVGVDVLFEPNAFDGRDAEFINSEGSDANGRFLPYWTRGDTGKIQVELLQEYDTSDWYQCPKTTKVSCLIDPYIYPVQGKDVWMTSLVVPFVVNDKFLGITGIDTPVTFLQELADKADIYNGNGKLAIISNNGTLLGVTGHPDLIGQPVQALHNDFSAEDYQKLRNGEETLRYDPQDQSLEVFVPIQVGDTATPWSVNVIIPNAAIVADASRQMWLMIGIGGGLFLGSLLALFFAARRIAQPIRKITDVALQVAGGNLNVVADVQSTDETGILADTFNQMTEQLRTSINTLEQRVADRAKALTTSAEVSRRLALVTNTRQLAKEVVEQVQSAFHYYHAHIYFVDPESKDLVMAGGTGEAGATMLARGHKIPNGRGLVGRAASTNSPILVPDVTQEEGWLPNPLLPETRSEAAVPIALGSQVLGVLDVQQNVVNGLGEDDINLLQSLAGQVAISLQNARTFEEATAKAEREALINTIGQKIQRAPTVEDTLKIAVRELGSAIGAAHVGANISGHRHNGNTKEDN